MLEMRSILITLALAVYGAASCTKSYTVKSGDNCDKIAVAQGVSSYQITRLNGQNVCSLLSIGQNLCLADTTYDCQPAYTVKSGDYCWLIANNNGISVDQLIADNPQLDPTSCPVYPGQSLCVSKTTPGDTTPPPTTTDPPPPTSTGCTKTYTVKSGDNCNAIAAAQGVSSYQITHLNGDNVCSLLQIGQKLCLADKSYDCQPVYVVKSGDFCSSIADKNGITLSQFLADNPQLDPNSCPVYPDLVVCVSKTTPGGTPTTDNPPGPTSTACTRLTTIQPGDSCDAICQKNKISNYYIDLINPANTCATLISGQAICVDSPLVDCSAVYTVTGTEGGCTNIATANKITFATLLELNPNVNSQCTNIHPGQVLCMARRNSTPPPSSGCSRTYTIVTGDTCTSIAAKNSITNAQLDKLNPTMNCNILVPGGTLCSFSPALEACPKLVKVAVNDNCFALAQSVSMSLTEWQSINQGVNCDVLLPGSVVCSAHGNATLPDVPSGTNPTAVPRCGSYNKKQQCCTQYSVAADLFSDLCKRENGCQDNCIGDPGVTKPGSAATPTTTIPSGQPARPTLPPPTCANCTQSQCCSKMNTCEPTDSWLCETAHGCKSNCDHDFNWVSPPGQMVIDIGNFTFPPGDYSATDGNPCGVCNRETTGVASPSNSYCCSQQIQCLPIEYADCLVPYGCLYNCLDVSYVDEIACGMGGTCAQVTKTVKNPTFPTST